MPLQVGEHAPDFELKSSAGEMVRFSDELKKRKWVVLTFFPAAFSSVCSDEMSVFQEALKDFQELGAGVLGISVDNWYSLQAFAEQRGLQFPLLSDFQPRGDVAGRYGVLGDDGTADRALFIVDQNGTVQYSYVSERRVNPGVDRVFDRLEELKEGKAKQAA